MRLFKKYCWPSLKRQTENRFYALLFIDPDTDPSYVNRLVVEDRIFPVLTDGSIGGAVTRWVRSRWGKQPRVVQTTRLDSDDALAPDYLSQIARAAAQTSGADLGRYFYFPRGQQYIERDGSYREYIYPANGFGTLIDRFDGTRLQTVMAKRHTEFMNVSYAQKIDTEKAKWCMVIHEGNVLNSVRGTKVETPDFRVG